VSRRRSVRYDWERVVRSSDLPPTTKLVALLLATHSGKNGGNAHPGNRALAEQVRCSTKTITRHLAALVKAGLIEKTEEGRSFGRPADGEKAKASVYRLISQDTQVSPDNPGTEDTRMSPDNDQKAQVSGDISAVSGDIWVSTHQPLNHHSASEEAGSATLSESDVDAILEHVDAEVGLIGIEQRTAEGMLRDGCHWRAVVAKVRADRAKAERWSATDARQP